MRAVEWMDGYKTVRYELFRRRCGLSFARKALLAVALAGLTGLSAQLRIVLPFTPVPVTGQVFVVLLAGVLLGPGFGAGSQVIYVALGSAGVPWFTGGLGGLPVGVTGGYLIGFIPAAGLIGWLSDRNLCLRHLWGQALVMTAGLAVIYFCGAVQFALLTGAGLWGTLTGAVLPFIPLDAGKAAAAALAGTALLPKVPCRDRTQPEDTRV